MLVFSAPGLFSMVESLWTEEQTKKFTPRCAYSQDSEEVGEDHSTSAPPTVRLCKKDDKKLGMGVWKKKLSNILIPTYLGNTPSKFPMFAEDTAL